MDLKHADIARFADRYFTNARRACEHAGRNPRVLYQVFQRHDALLCGMKYVLELLSRTSDAVEVHALSDGERIAPLEPVMHIIGPVQELFEYETLYLGLLARMTKIATNVREAVDAAGGKPVLFFPARFDAPEVQEYDGYAALMGGAQGASTPEEAKAFGAPAVGTAPHALIAAFQGNTAAATLALKQAMPGEPVWALVDFENDSARTAVACFELLRAHGVELTGVRLDTSQDLVDQSVAGAGLQQRGLTPLLVRTVRERLDAAGGRSVKIAVSGGFNPARIREFEHAAAPVDVYAVGEQFFRGSVPFTSDIVAYYDGDRLVPCAKVGRHLRPSPRLRRVK